MHSSTPQLCIQRTLHRCGADNRSSRACAQAQSHLEPQHPVAPRKLVIPPADSVIPHFNRSTSPHLASHSPRMPRYHVLVNPVSGAGEAPDCASFVFSANSSRRAPRPPPPQLAQHRLRCPRHQGRQRRRPYRPRAAPRARAARKGGQGWARRDHHHRRGGWGRHVARVQGGRAGGGAGRRRAGTLGARHSAAGYCESPLSALRPR